MSKQIKLSVSEIWDIVIDEHPNYQMVERKMTGNWRHGTEHTGVVEDKEGDFYRISWRNSSKDGMTLHDMMGSGPFEFDQVFKKEKTITVYE